LRKHRRIIARFAHLIRIAASLVNGFFHRISNGDSPLRLPMGMKSNFAV
jgi:hypothetical protein